ncbi:MAG: hypothetical protein R2713_17655 [Ilumatobacteraceae bacterium]
MITMRSSRRASTPSSPVAPDAVASTNSATPWCCGARSCVRPRCTLARSSRSFHLNSAFRPTYNMATSLVRTYTSERAHHLLNLSFAQYQADRDVVKIESRLERRQQHLRDLLADASSPYGDVDEYRRLLKRGSESAAPRTGSIGRDTPIELALLKLKPGDIVYAEKGRYAGRVAVTATAHARAGCG